MGIVVVGTEVYTTTFGDPPNANGELIRIAADGTVMTIESGLGSPHALWYDQTTDAFLFPNYFDFLILSRPLHADAGSVTTLISDRLKFPSGLASNADWIFVINYGYLDNDGQQTIQRRPRNDLTNYTFFVDYPAGPVHADIDANYLYWTEFEASRVVRRPVNAEFAVGTAVNEVIASGPSSASARGIAVDGAVIYFSRYAETFIDGGPVFGRVMRVDNVPNSTPVELANFPGAVDEIAVGANAIYVAGRESGTVWKIAK